MSLFALPHAIEADVACPTVRQVEPDHLVVAVTLEGHLEVATRETILGAGVERDIVQPPLLDDQMVFIQLHRVERLDLPAEELACEGTQEPPYSAGADRIGGAPGSGIDPAIKACGGNVVPSRSRPLCPG